MQTIQQHRQQHQSGPTKQCRPNFGNHWYHKAVDDNKQSDLVVPVAAKVSHKPRKPRQEAVVCEKQIKTNSANQLTAGGWAHSAGDIAFRDAILPSAPRHVSRKTLDEQIVASANKTWSSITCVNNVATLQTLSLRAVAENMHVPAVLEGISEGVLPSRLLKKLLVLLDKVYDRTLPFQVWKRLAQTFSDLPDPLKLYTDVVLDDKDVLRGISRFDASLSFTPSCEILTLLDLSGTALTKQDLISIRPLTSDTLVALRLDAVPVVSDSTIKDLARDALEGEAFPKLQILSVRRCVGVTDRSAAHLARFHKLQLLDLRLTSCTSATRELLRRQTRPPFVVAAPLRHRMLFAGLPLHQTLKTLLAVIERPWKAEEASKIELVTPPMLLVTELARVDHAAVQDPRGMKDENSFRSSHHLYGTVYTTLPFNREQLKEVGAHAVERGEASRAGRETTMQGVLEMGQTDRTWRKRTKIAKKAMATTQNMSEAIVTCDNSDNEDCTVVKAVDLSSNEIDRHSETPFPQSHFYQSGNIRSALHGAPIATLVAPERDNLAFVRFFPCEGSGCSEFLRAKRPVETTDNDVVAIKKKKTMKDTLTLLGVADSKPAMASTQRFAVPAGQLG